MLVRAAGTTAIPARDVDVVDTVGAGDTLNGALAAGLAAGLDLETAARRAVGASAGGDQGRRPRGDAIDKGAGKRPRRS